MNVRIGDEIPTWTVDSVDPARMKTMAAILRDPYTIHWDRTATAALGLGGRVVNQGPLNLGYIVNMLHAWAGPGCVRRLTVSFSDRVLDGDRVTASGRVIAIDDVESDDSADQPKVGARLATCDVWLHRGTDVIVSGSARVLLRPLDRAFDR